MPDIPQRLDVLRALALDLASLGEGDEYKKVKCLARPLYEDQPISQRACQAIEGFARAEGILKIDGAFLTLEQAKDACIGLEAAGERILVRRIQLARTELELAGRFGQPITTELKNIGEEGHRLAKENGYVHHGMELEKLLNT